MAKEEINESEVKPAEETVIEPAQKPAQSEVKVAKAGKRSAKAIEEAEEAKAKEERKAKVAAGELDPSQEGIRKGAAPVTRPRIERRSKGYRAAASKLNVEKQYDLKQALAAAIEMSFVKFDATVELHVRLNVDPKQADQNVRNNLVLPHGTGKTIRVAVFANTEDAKAALAAGADIAGENELLDSLQKEVINFDVLVTTPQMMPQLGRFARLLGPKGLMPNPKSGTVTKDLAQAVKNAKSGMVEYRVDQAGIVHLGVGKVSFGADKLHENAEAVMTSVKASKPMTIKGNYIESIFVTTSMGPSVRVSL